MLALLRTDRNIGPDLILTFCTGLCACICLLVLLTGFESVISVCKARASSARDVLIGRSLLSKLVRFLTHGISIGSHSRRSGLLLWLSSLSRVTIRLSGEEHGWLVGDVARVEHSDDFLLCLGLGSSFGSSFGLCLDLQHGFSFDIVLRLASLSGS